MSFGRIRAARGYRQLAHLQSVALAQEDGMNADVLTTRVADGIAVITLGSARRIYFDEEMGDALTEALDGFAGDANVRVVVVTGDSLHVKRKGRAWWRLCITDPCTRAHA